MRIVSCTRADAERELAGLAEGWLHLEDQPRWSECLLAIDLLRAGYPQVTAGHTVFRIQEGAQAAS